MLVNLEQPSWESGLQTLRAKRGGDEWKSKYVAGRKDLNLRKETFEVFFCFFKAALEIKSPRLVLRKTVSPGDKPTQICIIFSGFRELSCDGLGWLMCRLLHNVDVLLWLQ